MNALVKKDGIAGKIYLIRGVQVMLDSDLAELYGVPVKRLNEQVKRNINRFPDEFRVQLTKDEAENLRFRNGTSNEASLRSQNATLESSRGQHSKYLPYVFTEQGVAMLSAVLRSETAVQVSIQVMQAFVEMRRFMLSNADMFRRIDSLEIRQLQTEKKVDHILDVIGTQELDPKQGVFFNGQVFDAYTFVSRLVRKAKGSIVLIDNYVDDSVLTLLSKRRKGVTATIYCKRITKQLRLDLEKHNAQYEPVELIPFDKAHDRFLILDGETVYHIGASLKDLGKKWFAFSIIEKGALSFIERLP